MGGSWCTFDGWRQHPGGGGGSLSWPELADEHHLDAALGQRRRDRESDDTAANDYDFGAQVLLS
jgi:hypothetical protein